MTRIADTSSDAARPIRLAIIGAGAITRGAHLRAALRSPAFDVCALVDSRTETAAALARDFSLDLQVVSPSFEEVAGRADAVLIATPPASHVQLARAALERGLPVLVEKPFTINHADAVALCELAASRQIPIAVGYFARQHPSVSLLQHLLATEFLGRVISFDYEFGASGGWETSSGFNTNRAAAGGGVLIDTGTHFIDKMLYWFGVPDTFEYADDSFGGPEANCRATFQFHTGSGSYTGYLKLSKTIQYGNRLIVETDGYTCKLRDGQSRSVTVYPREHPELAFDVSARDLEAEEPDYFQRQLENFAAAIRGETTPTVDGWAAAESVHLIEQMYASRRQLDEPWSLAKLKCPAETHV
jgi:predicted dehydrogenase